MKRRILFFLVAAAVALAATLLIWRPWRAQRRPSIILISIDTCRADHMGFLGGGRLLDGRSPTPHLDRLASMSIAVKEGLSPVPLTLPAHVAMMSGLYPDASGVRENDSFVVPPRNERGYGLVAEELRAAGYDTAAFVSGQPLEKTFGLDAGFRIYVQPDAEEGRADVMSFRERSAEATTMDAVRYLRSTGDAPFFLFVHYFDPHHPYLRRPAFRDLPPGIPFDYLAEIMAVDAAVGALLDAVPGGLDDLLVIVTSDHGEGLGEHGEETHGYLLHDATLRVPMLVKPPRGTIPPENDGTPGRLVDLAPTMLETAGLRTAAGDGRSLFAKVSLSWFAAAETLYPYYQFQYARARAFYDPAGLKLLEDGSRRRLFDRRADPAEEHELGTDRTADAERLASLLREHGKRPMRGRASEREVIPNAAVPYFGGRPRSFGLEPSEEQNRKLPRVEDRWTTIGDLDRARMRIRDGRPAEALFVLARHGDELSSNPSLLFWSARAEDLSGRDNALSAPTRLAHFTRAEELYERHATSYDDGRGTDALIRLRLARYEMTDDPSDLLAAEKSADSEINRGHARPLTHALRGIVREKTGNLAGAIADLQTALEMDPADPKHRHHLDRLKALRARKG